MLYIFINLNKFSKENELASVMKTVLNKVKIITLLVASADISCQFKSSVGKKVIVSHIFNSWL